MMNKFHSTPDVPAIATIVAKNYLAQARTLTDSFLEEHPNGKVYVLLIDRIENAFNPNDERYVLFEAEDIEMEDFWTMTLRYDILELSTAVKPFFLEFLFKHTAHQKICYFDPDIFVYGYMQELWDALDNHAIVLTPHLIAPIDENHTPNEHNMLLTGIYNLGFIGLSRHPDALHLLAWWKAKLRRFCLSRTDKGLFVDQKWIDLIPGYYESIYIMRHAGYNTAYWDLTNRQPKFLGGKWTVNQVPLRFFHFSGYSPDRLNSISKYQDRFSFDDLPELKPLFDAYAEKMKENEYNTVKKWNYAFQLETIVGQKEAKAIRGVFSGADIRHPFTLEKGEKYDRIVKDIIAWLDQVAEETGYKILPRYIVQLHESNHYLSDRFPSIKNEKEKDVAIWLLRTAGKRIHANLFSKNTFSSSAILKRMMKNIIA
jgi:hypothetical protein